MPYQALLLDVGYVIIDLSWPALAAYEAATGMQRPGRDLVEPDGDVRWLEHRAGRITAEQYWDQVAKWRGLDGFTDLFRGIAEVVPDEMFDPAAVSLMRDARAAGRRVGALTNEAYSFLGKEFFASRPEFTELDAFVDATDVGARKPAAEAYLAAADALGVTTDGIVFLDDTPECVDGARRVGMVGILVDPFDRTPAFDQARELLGVTPNRRGNRLRRWPG